MDKTFKSVVIGVSSRYKKEMGTDMYLGSLGEVLDQAKTDGVHADIAVLDVDKAYNTLWRKGVLQQLHNRGIRGNLGLFIQQYLANRRFRVGIGGSCSELFTEENGVPLGSVLAVTLFLVSMQSLFATLPKGIFIFVYADDIVLVVTGKSIARNKIKLQAAINAVRKWAISVGFRLSASKCVIAHCCTSNHRTTDRPVRLEDSIIPFRKEVRILGIMLDRKLTFTQHFRQLKRDCESRKRLLRTICSRHPKCNRRTALNISQALVLSRLYYGLEITCRNLEGLVSILGPLYNSTARLASGLLPSTPAESACSEAGILSCRWAVAVVTLRRAIGFLKRTSGDDCTILDIVNKVHEKYSRSPLPQLARLHRLGSRKRNTTAPNVDTSLAQSVGAGANRNFALASYHQLVEEKFNNHEKLFTDGSKSDQGVGVGCSVFPAEAAAIALALTRKTEDLPVVIFTDSQSVISAITSGESSHPYVQAIEGLRDPLTTICWVPGHSGIPRNENADRLASTGYRVRRLISKEIPSADILDDFRKQVENDFVSHWRSSQGHFQKIKGNLETWTDRDSRLEQKILSRIRVGHTRLTHAHNVTRTNPPHCETCRTRLTVEYILINYRKLHDLRKQHQLPLSTREMLSNDPIREVSLLAFLKDAGIFGSM
ncbi:uncharacterized protein LOC131679308 [Topomyia yanbarensis]|uniref:uncharacterized protein LOC131679308 n=1 Tax=Topomyia yanbarensis TaxID=2498891 RepID=UPI00273CE7A8|nr:uncharacterized protein LOC131679308 [Topomyia yanbarensis]